MRWICVHHRYWRNQLASTVYKAVNFFAIHGDDWPMQGFLADRQRTTVFQLTWRSVYRLVFFVASGITEDKSSVPAVSHRWKDVRSIFYHQ